MRFFTEADLSRAAEAMLIHIDVIDKALLGIMSGIKRRARARAIINFAQQLNPPPPDHSITTMRLLTNRLFVRSISNNDLHRYFATPGRRADDRVDLEALEGWYAEHSARFIVEARELLRALEQEWRDFTREAARRTADLRQENRRAEQKRDAV